MGPLAAGLALGGASLIGGLLNNQAQRGATADTNLMMLEQARNAHAYEVQDLRAAGLNPMLSASGSGTAAPALSTPSLNEVVGTAAATGINSGMAVKAQNKEMDLKDAQIDNTHDDSMLKAKMANKTGHEARLVAEQKNLAEENVTQTRLQNKLLNETIPAMIKEAKAKGDWSQVNQLMGVIKSTTSSAKDVVDIANPIKINTGK